jgi:hypothetical protein
MERMKGELALKHDDSNNSPSLQLYILSCNVTVMSDFVEQLDLFFPWTSADIAKKTRGSSGPISL